MRSLKSEVIYLANEIIGYASPAIDPVLMGSPHVQIPDDPPPVDEHEVAFLLRHFGETAGQW